jgi:hypothetical protein
VVLCIQLLKVFIQVGKSIPHSSKKKDIKWKESWFQMKRTSNYWSSTENQRTFLEMMQSEYGTNIRTFSSALFRSHKGHGLLKIYNGSILAAFEAIYSNQLDIGETKSLKKPELYLINKTNLLLNKI